VATFNPVFVTTILIALAMIAGGAFLLMYSIGKVIGKPAVPAPVPPATTPVAAPAVPGIKKWWWGIVGGAVLTLVGLLWLGALVDWLAWLVILGLAITGIVLSAKKVGANKVWIVGIVAGSLATLVALMFLATPAMALFSGIQLPTLPTAAPAGNNPTPVPVNLTAQPTQAPAADPAFMAYQVVDATSTDVPQWSSVYGDASRTGTEEADTYAFYPRHAYLIVATRFNGVEDAVHLVYIAANTEQHLDVMDAEAIPALQGELISNVYQDGIALAGFKAAVKGVSSLPFYVWTVSDGGVIAPGISR